MAYEDIYKGLSEEERERMLKADIPKFEVIGEKKMTEEERRKAKEDLFKLIEEFKKH